MNEIIIAAIIVGAIGLLIGILLTIASEKFAITVNEKEIQIREELPGNNCGGCGYPGCDGLATAIVAGEAKINQCPVGGKSVADAIAMIMGVESEETMRMTAFVRCGGTCENATIQYLYHGIKDCNNGILYPGGDKQCSHGCMDTAVVSENVNIMPFQLLMGLPLSIQTCAKHVVMLESVQIM